MATEKIKFNSLQVSSFLTIMENHGFEVNFESDAQASAMFSELFIEIHASLDSTQDDVFNRTLI